MAGTAILKDQSRYERNFHTRILHINENLQPDGYPFLRKEHLHGGHKHKLSPIAEAPYRIITVDKSTVLLSISAQNELI